MDIVTVLKFLLGDGDSIRVIASSPATAIGAGSIFVISASVARHWNRRDLRETPWFLALPFVASLGTASLFTLMFSIWTGSLENIAGHFPVFLGLFWMTAPLAWFYGIPFERWAPRNTAIKVRLLTLLLVSAWRVALMIAVLTELFALPLEKSAVFVLMFGNVVALAALVLTRPAAPNSVPKIVTIMGGIEPKRIDEIRHLQFLSGFLIVVLVVTLIPGVPILIKYGLSFSTTDVWEFELATSNSTAGLWAFAFVALVLWIFLLPYGQLKQRLKTLVSKLIDDGELDRAVWLLDEMTRDSLPEDWLPPPQRSLTGESPGQLLDYVQSTRALPTTSWVRQSAESLFYEYLADPILYWFDDDRCRRVESFVGTIPPGTAEYSAAILTRLYRMEETCKRNKPFYDEHEDLFPDVASQPHFFTDWPELTEDRRKLRQWFLNQAGDTWSDPESQDQGD